MYIDCSTGPSVILWDYINSSVFISCFVKKNIYISGKKTLKELNVQQQKNIHTVRTISNDFVQIGQILTLKLLYTTHHKLLDHL